MHELIATPVRRRFLLDKHRKASYSKVLPGDDLAEASADLRELGGLIRDLAELPAAVQSETANLFDGRSASHQLYKSKFMASMRALKTRHERRSAMLEHAGGSSNEQNLSALLDENRKECLSIKEALGLAYKQRGALLCAADWQSPAYNASVPFGGNRLSQGIGEHSFDYKRDGHLDALVYEQDFVDQYYGHLGSEQLTAYLLNSGAAAWTNVLHWLAHDTKLTAPVVALGPLRRESMTILKSFFPDATACASGEKQDIEAKLQKLKPSIICLDILPFAACSDGQLLSTDLQAVLTYVKEESAHDLAIVVDATGLPGALLPSHLLKQLPDHVSVLFIESLDQHHVFGLGNVTAGIVVAHLNTALHESFKACRARFGTNITDTSVGALPAPNKTLFGLRLRRHARNTRMLADALQSSIDDEEGVFESVSWSDIPMCPWYAGSTLALRLRPEYRSKSFLRHCQQKIVDLCHRSNYPIGQKQKPGTDLTNVFLSTAEDASAETFLLVAPGSETKREIARLAKILKLVSSELALVGLPPVETITSPLRSLSSAKANVYAGSDGLKNYLTPANYAPTPLVELPSDLNPYKTDGVRIFAKMMPLVPLMNIKSIPAFSMLNKAAERGDLNGVQKIIESSSSNTVLSLSILAKLFGIDSTCAIVDHSIAPSLLRMLRLFGIEIFLHPAQGHEMFGQLEPRSQRATDCGQKPGWFNPGQYSNPDNPDGFERFLAPHIWEQTGGRISLLSCALGTCGTMVGVSRGLRMFNPDINVLACCPQTGHAVPGPREKSLLADVSFPWQNVADAAVELTAEESFVGSVKLIRRGIMGGPSSGMNYVGTLKHLEQEKQSGRLQQKIDRDGEQWVVFLCCDSPLPHVDEYFEALSDDFFPTVHAVPTKSHSS